LKGRSHINMKPLFHQKEKSAIGLDIGTQAIKAVKLKFLKDGAIDCCGFEVEPAQLDLEPALKKISQEIGAAEVNISLSGPAVVLRYINFPRMQQDELKQALRFEAQKHIPFSVNEVNLDAHIIKDDLPDNKMLVLVAAAKKDFIEERLKAVKSAGLKAGLIDVDSLALVNAFNFNYPGAGNTEQKAAALLNIGAQEANLNILDKAVPRLSRDIRIAGNDFTRKLMEVFNLDFKAAEELKARPDAERAEKIGQALGAVVSSLAAEIRVSFDYYESQGASSVNKIFLCGGSSFLPGIKEMLTNMLDIAVEYWDPFIKLGISADVDEVKLKALSAQMAVAVGLALR